ncbi:ethanolamine ammonia-lyase subunit EutC [Autumnicola musiva]|uniref:Ethanolamine ammonia-lyase small subunit n=1 Tax=Autumnicola musiva TaxID=3075589 RepID=A0ABU3D7A3_9FLAO|nr:ethanolamine ammonia-lyase subunit EutC [Zunongwangia sp. F117]MDT0677402.1 ethanolamine ammonia-lyase subunit EutC [Zunongwangia sp. F117]
MAEKPSNKDYLQKDNWQELKSISKARIALGNVGGSLPLKEVLSFQEDHAFAKDTIFSEFKTDELAAQFEEFKLPVYKFSSRAESRDEYLRRPDLGRQLQEKTEKKNAYQTDIAIIIADGLSANAVNSKALPMLKNLLPELTGKFSISLCLVKNARVAIGDEIGELLQAKFTAVLIGERPGLSSPSSMGIYTTYNPHTGLTDERRNCISNIHENGLSVEEACSILIKLIDQSFQKKISGVTLRGALKRNRK